MRDLDPAARRVLALAAAARTPSEEDKARVAHRLAVAVGASAALATASSAAHAANGLVASKWAAGLTATKAFSAVGALLAAALTGYALLSRSEPTRPAVPLTAAATARSGAAEEARSQALGDTSAGPEPSASATLHEPRKRAAHGLPSAAPSPGVAVEATSAPLEAEGMQTAVPRTAAGATHAPATSRTADGVARTSAPPTAAGATHAPATLRATDSVARTSAPPTAAGLRQAPARSARSDVAAVVQTTQRTPAGRAPAPLTSLAAADRARTAAPRPARDAAEPMTPASSSTGMRASAPSDTLGAELDLLHRAQVAWRSRDAASALALLNQHRERYPRSTLALERDALQVLTLCELGRQAEASRLAHSVLSRAPNSPLRASLEESCALK